MISRFDKQERNRLRLRAKSIREWNAARPHPDYPEVKPCVTVGPAYYKNHHIKPANLAWYKDIHGLFPKVNTAKAKRRL